MKRRASFLVLRVQVGAVHRQQANHVRAVVLGRQLEGGSHRLVLGVDDAVLFQQHRRALLGSCAGRPVQRHHSIILGGVHGVGVVYEFLEPLRVVERAGRVYVVVRAVFDEQPRDLNLPLCVCFPSTIARGGRFLERRRASFSVSFDRQLVMNSNPVLD